MILDSSAVLAILREESEGSSFAQAIEEASLRRLSAANFLEAAIVADGSRDPLLSRKFDDFLRDAHVSIEPVTERQALIAREAYRDYGKGSGHAAQLNYGDCFAYALAKDLAEPLLFKGNHFAHTDVRSAAPR